MFRDDNNKMLISFYVDDILFVKNREIAEQKEQSSNDEK